MCSIPPVPPPPPTDRPDINCNLKKDQSYNIPPDTCSWAIEHPELREVCARQSICVDKPPYRFKYKYFDSISQIGPTCGLVALSMLINSEISASEMLDIARKENYTCNGEMFSCKNMVKLTEKVFDLAKKNIRFSLRNEGLFNLDIIERLLNGAVLLVPYDADCNHSPCQRKGHTAHWALVCGIIVSEDLGNDSEKSPNNVYVLCKHGKSKYLAIWNLLQLDKSNKNLCEFSPKKEGDGLTYVLPEGGIGGENGLRDQFLLFEYCIASGM